MCWYTRSVESKRNVHRFWTPVISGTTDGNYPAVCTPSLALIGFRLNTRTFWCSWQHCPFICELSSEQLLLDTSVHTVDYDGNAATNSGRTARGESTTAGSDGNFGGLWRKWYVSSTVQIEVAKRQGRSYYIIDVVNSKMYYVNYRSK